MIYDVFLSHKSQDIEIVTKIYDELKKINPELSIFLSEKSLTEIGDSRYAETIEQAIKNSKNMIVVATKEEDFTTKWVNYEWRLFFHFQLNDKEGFYKNIITVTPSLDYRLFPDYLQMCENVAIDDYQQIYHYISIVNLDNAKKTEERKDSYLMSALEKAGWQNSLLFSSNQLSVYEEKQAKDLQEVEIIIYKTEYDTPGNALFEAVEKNLLRGVLYNYIFLDAQNARSILKKIYYGHSEEARKNLKLEYSNKSFWVLGDYANATIYKYKNRPMEGFFGIRTEMANGTEKTIYVKLSERIIDTIENRIEEYRDNDEIIEKKFE